MTEYDYSPGARERFLQKQRSVGEWAKSISQGTQSSPSQRSENVRSGTPLSASGGYGNAPSAARSMRSPIPSPRSGLAPLPPPIGTPTLSPSMSISNAPSPAYQQQQQHDYQQYQQQPQQQYYAMSYHSTLQVPQPQQQPYMVTPSHAPFVQQNPPVWVQPPPMLPPMPAPSQQSYAPSPVAYSSNGTSPTGYLQPPQATIIVQDDRSSRSRSSHRSSKSRGREGRRSKSAGSATYIIHHQQPNGAPPVPAMPSQTPYIVIPRKGNDVKVYYV